MRGPAFNPVISCPFTTRSLIDGSYSNSNDILVESELQLGDTEQEGVSPPDFDRFLGSYNEGLQQVLDPETCEEADDLGDLEFRAPAIRQSIASTPTEYMSLDDTPGEDGTANWPNWESEDVDMDLSLGHHEPQLESPTPTTSNAAAGLGRPICGPCNKSFSRISDLRRHEKTHLGEGYVCQLCGTPCSRLDALRRHMKKKHKD